MKTCPCIRAVKRELITNSAIKVSIRCGSLIELGALLNALLTPELLSPRLRDNVSPNLFIISP